MFRLLKRKKKEMVSMELPIHNIRNNSYSYETQAETISHPDSKMARLMELIGCAIENWAAEYHLENLPKKIVFEQALDAMRAIELAINNTDI